MRGDDDARIIQTNDKVEEFSVCYPGNETLGLRVFTRIITPVVERTPAPPPPRGCAGRADDAAWKYEVGGYSRKLNTQNCRSRVEGGSHCFRRQHFAEMSSPTPRTERVWAERADRWRKSAHTRLGLAPTEKLRGKKGGGGSAREP